MALRTNELLIVMLLIVWGSYVSASRKLLTDRESPPAVEEEKGSSSPPKTITFFMYHSKEGIHQGSGLPNQFGNNVNFNGIGNGNGNGNGPLLLTIPSGAINNSPFTTGGRQGFGFQNSFPNTNIVNGGAQGLGSLTPSLRLQNTNSINGSLLNPQNPLAGASGMVLNNVIVIEDTLTEGLNLHSSAMLGKGEGYYYRLPTPAEEGDLNTMLLTFKAKFEGSEYGGNNIEFSGKENMALEEREIAVVCSAMLRAMLSFRLFPTQSTRLC